MQKEEELKDQDFIEKVVFDTYTVVTADSFNAWK